MRDFFDVTKEKMLAGGLDTIVAALYLPDLVQNERGEANSWALVEKQFHTLMGLNPWIPFELGLEGGRLLGSHDDVAIERLKWLADRSCRYLTLTHNFNTFWAGSATDVEMGLRPFGRGVIKVCEQLGIYVDVSHASDLTAYDAIEASTRPVIATHSGVRSLVDHPRNLSDDLIYQIAQTGGVIGVPFVTKFVGSKEGVIDAIDRIAQLLGSTKSIGIGSDLDGAQLVIKDASEWSFWIEPLRERGYSQAEIDGIAGENFRRIFN